MTGVSISDRILALAARVHARRVLARFEADVRRARDVQERLLSSLIHANATSAYGRQHGFRSIRGYEDFVRQVPISTYADLSPWVERVMGGDVRAMFGPRQRVRMFAMTSGTVDRPKYVPVTDRFLRDLRGGWNAFGIKALTDHADCFMRPIVQVTSPMDEERTAAGFPCGAITGLMAATQKRLVRKYYVAPLCVAYISDAAARRYAIMRLAIPADVAWIVTASPATVLQLAKTGETHAESLIRDIHDGSLSAEFDIPRPVHEQLRPRLTPDPAAARRLQHVLDETGTLKPKNYWRLGFLANWTGGTMGLYVREFPAYFGDVPVRDIGLLATEGRLSIPVADGTAAGIAAISSVFFEFIPAGERDRPKPTVLRVHEVQPGEEYFILLTNSAGFYRYDINDCVRVVGFAGQAPLIEFLHKGDHVSSITGEKITENQVVMAFERASRQVAKGTCDFVLAPRWGDPPFYRLYVEEMPGAPDDWATELAMALDRALGEINIEYASKRSSGRLATVDVRTLEPGRLTKADGQRAIRYRRSNEQFKHQYLYTRPGDDDMLASAVTFDAPPAIRATTAAANER